MGTPLQEAGLPLGHAADTWVEHHPEEVAAVHRRAVSAGARVLRTATLCTRPDREPQAFARRAAAAIDLARSASPDQVWWSVGPAGPERGPVDALDELHELPVDAILLETFVDGSEALEALAALHARRGSGHPVLVSLVPRPDGRLLDGGPPPVDELLAGGAAGVGFNCGSPRAVQRAVASLPAGGPWLAAPAAGPGLADALAALAPRVRWLGACCGVTPEALEAAWPRS